jgi:hypothetical protein
MKAVNASELTKNKKTKIRGEYQNAKNKKSAVIEFRKALRNKNMQNRRRSKKQHELKGSKSLG